MDCLLEAWLLVHYPLYLCIVSNLQKGRTPLHLACVGEHVEVAKCVAVYDPSSLHGIDKVIIDQSSPSPTPKVWFDLNSNNNKKYLCLLSHALCCVLLCLQNHRTALHIACKRHVPSLCEELVRCKSCIPYKVDKVSAIVLCVPTHFCGH